MNIHIKKWSRNQGYGNTAQTVLGVNHYWSGGQRKYRKQIYFSSWKPLGEAFWNLFFIQGGLLNIFRGTFFSIFSAPQMINGCPPGFLCYTGQKSKFLPPNRSRISPKMIKIQNILGWIENSSRNRLVPKKFGCWAFWKNTWPFSGRKLTFLPIV